MPNQGGTSDLIKDINKIKQGVSAKEELVAG